MPSAFRQLADVNFAVNKIFIDNHFNEFGANLTNWNDINIPDINENHYSLYYRRRIDIPDLIISGS